MISPKITELSGVAGALLMVFGPVAHAESGDVADCVPEGTKPKEALICVVNKCKEEFPQFRTDPAHKEGAKSCALEGQKGVAANAV